MRLKAKAVAPAIVIALCAPLAAGASERELQPGEGVMCMLALSAAASHAAEVCHAGEAPEVAADLKAAADRLGRYVVENGWTTDQLADFLRDQGKIDAPPETFCGSGVESFYQAFRAAPPGEMDRAAARLTARPGKPSWGDCV